MFSFSATQEVFNKGGQYKSQDSLSADISPLTFSKKPSVSIHPTDMHRFFRNLSRSASNEYNPNIMTSNSNTFIRGQQKNNLMMTKSSPAPSSCSSSRSTSPAAAAATPKKKNDKAVEVLNESNIVIARFRTQTECAQFIQATPEAVSYHCSNPKKRGGVCNGLVIRPCDYSDNTMFGLFDGAEEARPKKRAQLNPATVAILKQWLLSPEHIDNPYPSPHEMKLLMQRTGLDRNQLKHWFNNARKRILKPMLAKKKAAGDSSHSDFVRAKRKEAPDELPKERSRKKAKVAAAAAAAAKDVSERSGSSLTKTDMNLPQRIAKPSDLPLSQFGSMFGSARSGVVNTASGMVNHGSIFPSQQQEIQSQAAFKQQVATMAMNEANAAFKSMEEAYAMAKQVMAAVQLTSGENTNIDDDPRVIDVTAHAKKLHSVAMFKLKVSKRASEEAEKAFEMVQGFPPANMM